ncbi:MAG: PIN domain-containing protein [Candidatus Firestonebacteria bacterium]
MLTLFRIIFIVVCGVVGFFIAGSSNSSCLTGIIIGVVGSFVFVLLDIFSGKISLKDLLAILVGLTFGLIIASLLSYGISHIPSFQSPEYVFVPMIIYLICIYLGVVMVLRKKDEFLGFKSLVGIKSSGSTSIKILDTSVIIDGRVAEILEIGFLDGEIVIPRFVLQELQMIADSPDAIKRNRGRRGLDILNKMQKLSSNVKVYEDDFPETHKVDEKLLKLAKKLNAKVITNDFNLNKVAELEKIKALNLNDLSNAVKPIVLPGEAMKVRILKEGKELTQGIAYLDDGTMIVIDGAKNFINKDLEIIVTSAIQTSAGRMIFAKRKEDK